MRKSRELQVDLVFSGFPCFLVSLAAAAEAAVLTWVQFKPYALISHILLGLLLFAVFGERRLYRRRCWEGHI